MTEYGMQAIVTDKRLREEPDIIDAAREHMIVALRADGVVGEIRFETEREVGFPRHVTDEDCPYDENPGLDANEKPVCGNSAHWIKLPPLTRINAYGVKP